MKYIIDRFEGDYAVCQDENKNMINIHVENIPAGVTEGTVLVQKGSKYYIDENETRKRKEKIQRLMDDLWI